MAIRYIFLFKYFGNFIFEIVKITPTSTLNSRLYSRTYLVFVLAKCHRSAMPLWFHWVFESQRRRHARLVSIGAGRRRRRRRRD